MAPEINVVEVLVRLAASLAMVVAVIVVVAKVLRARGGLRLGRNGDGPRLDVLDRAQVARNASVAVVRVGGRGLVVGITEQSVSLLVEAPELIDRYEHQEAERTVPPAEQQARRWRPAIAGARRHDAAAAPETTRMSFFEALREATVRRS